MRGNRLYVCLLGLLFLLSAAAHRGQAQTKRAEEAMLQVRVFDPSNSTILNAQLRLTGADGKVHASESRHREGASVWTRLAPGHYHLHIEGKGFETRDIDDIEVKSGANQIQVQMEVAIVKESVAVTLDKVENSTDPRGNSFSSLFSKEQIAQLPDDPEELEATLRQMAGPGAVIRVNGFRSGKLPPKSQIQEIRFRRNSYAAENHEAGLVTVDILTKPGLNKWHGTLSQAFRDDSLNARNAFAPVRGPEQYRRFGLELEGPLWRNRTSFFLSTTGAVTYDSKTLLAALPGRIINDVLRRPSRTLDITLRLEHSLTQTHALRTMFQRAARREDNLGAGDFNLPQRAYSTGVVENLLRVSDSGPLSPRLFNEVRFQARWLKTETLPVSDQPAIQVLNAFNDGGAQLRSHRHARTLELEDGLDFSFGKHLMRTGILAKADSYQTSDAQNENGTFTFASLADYATSRPATYTRRIGDPAVAFTQYQFASYWQDDIRLHKNLTLSLGVRLEMQSHLRDKNNFAPRFGLAWSPFADGKTTFRGGGGLFYNWFTADAYEQTLRVDGLHEQDFVVLNPGFPNPLAGGIQLALPPSRYQRDPSLKMPYLEQVSVSGERELGKNLQFVATYLAQRGVHQIRSRNINAPVLGNKRPDPAFGNIVQFESSANSSFRILNLTLTRLARRYQIFASYSYTHIDNEADSPFDLPADNYNLRGERGPSLLDIRHSLFMLANVRLYKGIRLGGFFYDDSATPYNIITGLDNNGDSILNDRPPGVQRNSARGALRWDFSARLSWGFGFGKRDNGSLARPNAVAVGPQTTADVLGSFSPSETSENRWHVSLYLQANNLFNHANPTNFSGVQTSPFYGMPTAAAPGRRLETGLKFSF